VEVQGIVEDLASCDVVGSVDDVIEYRHRRLGIVCQTTLPPHLAEELCVHIQLHNPLATIRFVDTICEPTRQRQRAMVDLLERVPAVVVVGGKHSNNTLQLVALCQQHGTPVLHVQSAADLDVAWLARFETVGLTAGTSTLDRTIAEVYQALVGSPAPSGAT
jgi:4-hydroxy-3-methylbut-2-enyl diphosphate reductase